MFKSIKNKALSFILVVSVIASSCFVVLPVTVSAADAYSYESTHWLYIGWENDYPKSRTYMGGGVRPGMSNAIQYTFTVDGTTYSPDEFAADRKTKIKWYLRDGYQPCPTSEWDAGTTHVTIQHFANRILSDSATAVYSRVTVKNNATSTKTIRININAGTGYEVPLSGNPTFSDSGSMYYDVSVTAGATVTKDFVAKANGTATAAQLQGAGTFDSNYTSMATYYDNKINSLTHPVALPDTKMLNMFKAEQITLWESMVKTNNANYYLLTFNWFTIGSTTTEAENYNTMSGVATGTCKEGTLQVYAANDGDWIAFNNYDFGTGQTTFSARAALDYMNGHTSKIEIRLDSLTGPIIGNCNIEPTQMNDWNYFQTFSTNITNTTGTHNLYLIFKKTGPDNINYEARGEGGGGSYDRIYTHDVPNIVDEFIREGDYDLAKRILTSPYYLEISKLLYHDYVDAIPKYLLPYATYLKNTGDTAFFTAEVRTNLQNAAHQLESYRYYNTSDPNHNGIIRKSNTLDNGSTFLLIDNMAWLGGLQAYKYVCDKLGNTTESTWAANSMSSLNSAFNNALTASETRRGVNWYMSCFDDTMYWPNYTGNYFASSICTSAFPWDGYLNGYSLGGTWKDHYENSIANALAKRTQSGTPVDSWGEWSVGSYGNVYNGGQGLQCMLSDTYRTEVCKNLEWMLKNESAPFQWGESFKAGLTPTDWTTIKADYETWGLSFMKQALLEACCSVKTDGTVIIGRGLLDSWVADGKTVQWSNVNVGNGKKINFTITGGANSVSLAISGNAPNGNIVFNLPIFKNNIVSASAGTVDNSAGTVTLPANTTTVTVNLAPVSQGPKYEAENGTLVGCNAANDQTGYSGTGFVGYLNAVGDSVTMYVYVPAAGDYNVDLRYASGQSNARTMSIYVNDVKIKQSSYPSTGGWSTWGDVTDTLPLTAGNNRIMYKCDTGDSAGVNLDYINLSLAPPVVTRYEAEDAALVGCNAANDQTGYSGTGFVGYLNAEGDSATFTVNVASAGSHNVDLRYASGQSGARTMSIYVNGVKIKRSSYSPTGGWSSWGEVTDTLTLNAGNNTIMYKCDTGDSAGVNLDYINVWGK